MENRRGYLAWALGLNYAAMMALAIAVNLCPVLLTTLQRDLGNLRYDQLGLIGSVTFVGLVAGILLTGPLADRFGARPFAVFGNVLIALGLAGLALAPNYPTVLVMVGLMGFGAGVLDMVLSPIVAALQPDNRTSAMNWLHSFYCIGAVVTILVSALALRLGMEWRTLTLWMVLLPVPVAAGFLVLRVPPLVAEGVERMRLRELIRQRAFLIALVAIFLAGATELGIAQWLPAYAEQGLHYSRLTGGMAFVAFSAAMAIGRIIVGMIGHRFPPLRLMTVCCWASVVLFLLTCFAPWPPVALAAAVAVGLTGSSLWPSMLGVAADRFPRGGASMFGLLAALGNFGGIFMPGIVGLTADLTTRTTHNVAAGMSWGIATATLCPLLMALLLPGLRGQTAEVTAKTTAG